MPPRTFTLRVARDLKEDGSGSVSEQSFYGFGGGQYTADHDSGMLLGFLNAKS